MSLLRTKTIGTRLTAAGIASVGLIAVGRYSMRDSRQPVTVQD